MTLLYNPILGLVKNAMLLLYLRLEAGTMDNLRRVTKGVLVINTALMVSIFTATALQCIPISKSWSSTETGRCIDKGAFYCVTGGITILTKNPVILIPSWMLFGLQMPLKKKAAIICVLSLGFM